MPDTVTEDAPAKVNLALHVTGQRHDGYHLLETMVVFTEFGDRVAVRLADADAFDVTGPFAEAVTKGGDNLVLRASDLLRSLSDRDLPPVSIMLEKNLPVASGVGGGSSDAAATLRALVQLFKLSVSPAKLAEAALALGADLPMCLEAKTLLARGVGEETKPVEGWPTLAMVLINPGVAVATPDIFRALAKRDNPPLPAPPRRPDFATIVEWLKTARNDLEPAAVSIAPQITDALAALNRSSAALARMSGSGATCFGLYPSQAAATRAAAEISASRPGWFVEATRTIEKVGADVSD